MVNIYKNIEDYNPNKKQKILNDDMIADMLSNKKLNPIKTELFTRGRKPTISVVFTTQYYFAVLKYIRLNSTHYFIMKFPNKQELNNLHLKILQILIFKILLVFMKNVLKTIFFFTY